MSGGGGDAVKVMLSSAGAVKTKLASTMMILPKMMVVRGVENFVIEFFGAHRNNFYFLICLSADL